MLQYRLERSRWKLALYDKRYPVFTDTMAYIADILGTGANPARTTQFLRETMVKELLFGPEVHAFMDSLYNKGVDLWTTRDIVNAGSGITEEQRKSSVYEVATILKWFGDQFEATKAIFEPYLRISQK